MSEELDAAVEALRHAFEDSTDLVRVELELPREIARKVLRLLEAEDSSGAVVVPVRTLYTTTQAAAMLGISRATLMKLIEAGDIEAVKVGTHHRISTEELVAYQRSIQVSRARASELMSEFSARSTRFQSNVIFQADVPNEE